MEIVIIILSVIIFVLFAVAFYLLRLVNCEKKNRSQIELGNATMTSELDSTKQSLEELKQRYLAVENTSDIVSKENAELKVVNGKLEERIIALGEQSERIKEETAKMREETESHFKAIAQEILAEKSKAFKEANELRLSEILNPFKENIEQFKRTINDNYINEAKERHTLQEHIKELMELNQSIGKEAKDLTQALKGNTKMQGDWGEMILETILEKSGLNKGQEYQIQVTRDENGNVIKNELGNYLRPDVIVYMPDDKKMIIDSKVSLNAYVNFVNAEDKETQEKYAAAHVQSVRNHINELKTKKYQDYVRSAGDFIMMFIPNEGAYLAAMQQDTDLWQYAYDNMVVIISPTHLISALKLINQLWQHDRQTKNAIEIAEESGKLYDKFCGFVADMENISKNITGTKTAFDSAMNKLQTGRGNLINQVNKLKTLGAKAKKSLPESSSDDE